MVSAQAETDLQGRRFSRRKYSMATKKAAKKAKKAAKKKKH
jgi:hypothetical protein